MSDILYVKEYPNLLSVAFVVESVEFARPRRVLRAVSGRITRALPTMLRRTCGEDSGSGASVSLACENEVPIIAVSWAAGVDCRSQGAAATVPRKETLMMATWRDRRTIDLIVSYALVRHDQEQS